MYFKSEYHKELFEQFLSKLNTRDSYLTNFAYVSSAIGNKNISNALDVDGIDYDILLDLSKTWTNAEKAMLEVAIQLFSNGNFHEVDGDIQFPNFHSIFVSLDDENSRIVLKALEMRYVRNIEQLI